MVSSADSEALPDTLRCLIKVVASFIFAFRFLGTNLMERIAWVMLAWSAFIRILWGSDIRVIWPLS